MLRKEPLATCSSHVHFVQSAILFSPQPSKCQLLVSSSVSTSGKADAFLWFQAGSISEPHDCRAELSRAVLESRLHIPHAAHISETDKILSLGIIKGKKTMTSHSPLRNKPVGNCTKCQGTHWSTKMVRSNWKKA